MSRRALVLSFLVLLPLLIVATGPPRPQPTTSASPTPATWRGAFHIHTTRSDGAADKQAVAEAAARAGLQFAIFTDHGDGTRAPDPPEIIAGVLCIDGVEISTNGGHYIALGMAPSPYPLGGDADAVVEDVARLGGLGIAAHPFSPRGSLAWTDWDAPIDGLEWANADSEWRDEGRARLSRALLDYLWRPAGALASLLDRPASTLAKWDQISARRPAIALAGHDAHGGIGVEAGGTTPRLVRVPSYEASFRTFSIHARVADSGGAVRERADALLQAIRSGAVFTAVDAVAAPAAFQFRGSVGGIVTEMGETMAVSSEAARFTVRAAVPPGGRVALLRDGKTIAEAGGGDLDHETQGPGVYRVEVHAPRAPGSPAIPWLVSNPIYRMPPRAPVAATPAVLMLSSIPLDTSRWRVEHSPGSSGTVTSNGGALDYTYRLDPGARASQFSALATDLPGLAAEATAISLRGRASRPMRLSVQLRFAKDGEVRWLRSVYLDDTERDVSIQLDRLRPAEPSPPLPDLSRATSLLLVVDLVNAVPGAEGTVTLSQVGFGRFN